MKTTMITYKNEDNGNKLSFEIVQAENGCKLLEAGRPSNHIMETIDEALELADLLGEIFRLGYLTDHKARVVGRYADDVEWYLNDCGWAMGTTPRSTGGCATSSAGSWTTTRWGKGGPPACT
jgi:hypothetical protein